MKNINKLRFFVLILCFSPVIKSQCQEYLPYRTQNEWTEILFGQQDKQKIDEAYFALLLSVPSPELLIYSLHLADSNRLACGKIWDALTLLELICDTCQIDSSTLKLALLYLSIGAKIEGDEDCNIILGELYLRGLFVKKDTTLGLKLLSRGNGAWIIEAFHNGTMDPLPYYKQIPKSITFSNPYIKLKEHTLITGDTNAYKKIAKNCSASSILMLSILMANKYHYVKANYQVYLGIVYEYHKYKVPIPKRMKDLAIEYLEQGAESGDMQCASILKDL